MHSMYRDCGKTTCNKFIYNTFFSDLLHEVEQLMDGCSHHYYKSLARSAAFTVAMVTPSKVR